MRERESEVDSQHHSTGNALDATPMEIVDLLLWALVDLAGSVTISPDDACAKHVIRHERAGVTSDVATVPSSFGDALAARVALVAGLSVGVPGAQFGRLRVRLGSAAANAPVNELLVAVRSTRNGLEAEVHRVASGVAPTDEDASPESIAAGRGLIGMYRILDTLGQGGMGVVYLAEHVALEKQVALKVVHPESAGRPTIAAQFLVEGRAACRARHPGIVDVTDFGTLRDGRSYLVMELVAWPTLSTILHAAEGPLPLARAITIAKNVAGALAAAAARGVIHGDLTPANIFVGAGDATKVGDFGLARIMDRGAPVAPMGGGTAGYVSPEQWCGEHVDSRSDIYSLGVILFRLATGEAPFTGTTPADLFLRHASDPVPLAIGADGPLPDGLQRIVQRAMAKQPIERFQTFDEMLLALDEIERSLQRTGWQRWLA